DLKLRQCNRTAWHEQQKSPHKNEAPFQGVVVEVRTTSLRSAQPSQHNPASKFLRRHRPVSEGGTIRRAGPGEAPGKNRGVPPPPRRGTFLVFFRGTGRNEGGRGGSKGGRDA